MEIVGTAGVSGGVGPVVHTATEVWILSGSVAGGNLVVSLYQLVFYFKSLQAFKTKSRRVAMGERWGKSGIIHVNRSNNTVNSVHACINQTNNQTVRRSLTCIALCTTGLRNYCLFCGGVATSRRFRIYRSAIYYSIQGIEKWTECWREGRDCNSRCDAPVLSTFKTA